MLAIFVFGAAMMALLFRAPRSSDQAPANVPMSAPRRSLRIVSINLRGRSENGGTIGRWLKQIDADVYFLQGVRSGDVE